MRHDVLHQGARGPRRRREVVEAVGGLDAGAHDAAGTVGQHAPNLDALVLLGQPRDLLSRRNRDLAAIQRLAELRDARFMDNPSPLDLPRRNVERGCRLLSTQTANWRFAPVTTPTQLGDLSADRCPLNIVQMAAIEVFAEHKRQRTSVDRRHKSDEILGSVRTIVIIDQPGREAGPVTVAAI
jgi:hypothetical protein